MRKASTRKTASSRFMGVCRSAKSWGGTAKCKSWRANICWSGFGVSHRPNVQFVGAFRTERAAALAHDRAILVAFGLEAAMARQALNFRPAEVLSPEAELEVESNRRSRSTSRAYPIEINQAGQTAEVVLAGGAETAVIDAEDADLVSAASGCWHRVGAGRAYVGFASITIGPDGRRRISTRLLHRLVVGAKPGQLVLNRSGNPLDCRKSNLVIIETKRSMS